MKVRTKFTALISLASFICVMFFSSHFYREIREEIYEMLDYELADIAELLFSKLHYDENGTLFLQSEGDLELLNHGYWLKIDSDISGTLFRSKFAKLTELPPADTDKAYFVTRTVPIEHFQIPLDEADDISGDQINFRVRMFRHEIGKETITVHIAKPVLLWDAELGEILYGLIGSLLLTVLLIIATAYFVAGRLLHPISIINRRITRIRESSLDERIPLGKSRDELYELSASLNSMFDRLEHSFNRQKDFVGNAAHEMKSPLTILMLGHEEMLAGDLEKDARANLEKQLYCMQRLNKLIRDLLNIARLEQRDTVHREHVDIPQLITAILEDYREVIREKNITVTTSLPQLTVKVDQEKFLRLFINLIDNAIKYNHDRNGTLQILGKKSKGSLVISLSNSGPVIPPADIPNIFKQFYRVEKSRSQAYGGSGLGLTIAQRIMEMHSGTITVTSDQKQTTFTITFPDGG
ncbi:MULTISPECIES: sensor histidine kinase [Desulfosediminicola]|uniref:sensor histidine kinase n=1 Tax=Desulfosediminicola TaxID=2886823 RepID=UPI0010ACED66|nr:ATP-binding protein [Desulfosediminicola ganghwensis]